MSAIEDMTNKVLTKNPSLDKSEVHNQVRDAVLFITDSLHANFHDNMSGTEFCDRFERWSKTAPKVKMACGFTVSMSKFFPYAWRVEESLIL